MSQIDDSLAELEKILFSANRLTRASELVNQDARLLNYKAYGVISEERVAYDAEDEGTHHIHCQCVHCRGSNGEMPYNLPDDAYDHDYEDGVPEYRGGRKPDDAREAGKKFLRSLGPLRVTRPYMW